MPDQQITSDVLMIRPANFCRNSETSDSNRFQRDSSSTPIPQQAAEREFKALESALREAQVRVHQFEDSQTPVTPDALFPNNWVSFHADGTVALYPMLAPNRRLERRQDILRALSERLGFQVRRTVDLTCHENEGRFLEGTGSLVLDRANRIAYACLSPRTHRDVIEEFARLFDYRAIVFNAIDLEGVPIYHTNVLMSIGTNFAAVCAESICADERSEVIDTLCATGHKIIELSHQQMNEFAGNMLELSTSFGGKVIALSRRAEDALTQQQRRELEYLSGPMVTAAIPTIETLGGGSVRCMLAEIHLPRSMAT